VAAEGARHQYARLPMADQQEGDDNDAERRRNRRRFFLRRRVPRLYAHDSTMSAL
jgi:hypothetical protein